MTEFWQRLKQRKLVQWAVAYTAAAFALLQVVDIVGQKFGWPDSAGRILIIALCVGFFVALLLAWYHGERGAQKVSGTELLLLALLLAIGGGLLWKFAASSPASIPATAATITAADDGDRRSIAVLPFVNMSGDKNNEYFSDGISEEILNVLAKTPDLHVAARTSSFAFKGEKREIPDIARELNVRMVLEGSVRKQGDRVRITAQLIDAKTGFHVFSQTYDRELKDIFAIQDEIARAIGGELEVKLADAPAPGKNSVGTTDLKAYDLFLRGIALWQTRNEENIWQSVDVFGQAITADPTFAQAYGGLALAYSILPDYSGRISYPDAFRQATDAAEMALVLDPTLPEPYAALGTVASWELRRSTAIALYRRAIALRPSFATAHQWLGTDLMAAGNPIAALAELERASELDPLSRVVGDNHSVVLKSLGRNEEARSVCERILAFAPDYAPCALEIATAELQLGRLDEARLYFSKVAEINDPGALPLVTAVMDALQGHGDRQAIARRLAAFSTRSSLDPDSGNIFGTPEISMLLVKLGAPELALDYLEKSAVFQGSSPVKWAMVLPALDPIRCTPRFKALVVQRKTHDPRAATVCATSVK